MGLAASSIHGDDDVRLQALLHHLSLVRPEAKRFILESSCDSCAIIVRLFDQRHESRRRQNIEG